MTIILDIMRAYLMNYNVWFLVVCVAFWMAVVGLLSLPPEPLPEQQIYCPELDEYTWQAACSAHRLARTAEQ